MKANDEKTPISPALQGWLTSVLIPALVDQYLSKQGLTLNPENMRESKGHSDPGEVQRT